MDAIRTDTLTKHFSVGFWRPRPYVALDGLSLSVAQGEVFGFLGPNGAGKTTTLKLLMQLIFPTSGRADILGRPVGDVDTRRRIGYLPENPYFYDHLTAEELLVYFAGLFGYSGHECRSRAGRLLDEVGLGSERRLQLRKFSKGMIQRVGIAQALVNDPDVVFFDEPMSGLDPIGRRDMRALILRLRDGGKTVFFSSHVLSDAEALCSRVGIVVGGRLVAAGRLSEMLASHVRGWDVVASGLTAEVVERTRASGRIQRVSQLGSDRVGLEFPLSTPPEQVIAEVASWGGQLVSLNPLHDTLEDFFVRQVAATAVDRGPGALSAVSGHAGAHESRQERAR
jgi:ABC-2 type transport system ATP-binding protein